ncbi:MAG TPA: hypothetical protein EYG51_03355 [Pseudomonadales bacterium]|nr:hypothetical protein [Pseudomonadales bacterium]
MDKNDLVSSAGPLPILCIQTMDPEEGYVGSYWLYGEGSEYHYQYTPLKKGTAVTEINDLSCTAYERIQLQ